MRKIFVSLFVFSVSLFDAYGADWSVGLKVSHGTSTLIPAIYEGVNYKLTNTSGTKDFFVPMRSSSEWSAFKANLPPELTMVTDTTLYKSCQEIKSVFNSAVDGPFFIDVYSGSTAKTYCDMTTDGGGWTLVLKATGSDRTTSFGQSIASSWMVPMSEGDASNLLPQTTFHDGVYSNHPVQDLMIRSLADSSKKLVWTQGSNSPSLKFMIDGLTQMRGKITGGGVSQLDYRSGCDVGVMPSTLYAGIYPSDEGSSGTQTVFMNGGLTHPTSWFGAVIGWGSDTADYNSGVNTAGGFGTSNYVGSEWNFSRHVHGMGHGCTAAEYASSGGAGTQTMYGHALFVREGSYKKSCKEINDAQSGLPSGVYTIKPGATAIQVYCDMTRDGGGWTLVMSEDFLHFTNQSGMGTTKICTNPTKCNTEGTSSFYRGTTVESTLSQFRFSCNLEGNIMSSSVTNAILYNPANFIRETVTSPGRTLFDLMTDSRRGWAATNIGSEPDGTGNDPARFFYDTNGGAWSDGNWHGITDSEGMQLNAPIGWGHHHYAVPTNNGDGTYTVAYTHMCGPDVWYGKVINASQVSTARWQIWVK